HSRGEIDGCSRGIPLGHVVDPFETAPRHADRNLVSRAGHFRNESPGSFNRGFDSFDKDRAAIWTRKPVPLSAGLDERVVQRVHASHRFANLCVRLQAPQFHEQGVAAARKWRGTAFGTLTSIAYTLLFCARSFSARSFCARF